MSSKQLSGSLVRYFEGSRYCLLFAWIPTTNREATVQNNRSSVVSTEPDGAPVRLTYQFGAFEFSTIPLTLVQDRKRVDTRPQALRLLELLLANIGRIVTIQFAVAHLWPMGDGNARVLRVTVTHLRRALDSGDDTPYIETIRGQGYRFVHPVEITEEELIHRRDQRRRSLFGA